MKRNNTIINEVKKSYWNETFLEKAYAGTLSGEEEYWHDTVLKFAELCLFKLREEYSQNKPTK